MKKPHGRPASDYAREDATLRGVWLATAGLTDARAIRDRAACADGDALRIALVRTYASPVLVAAWLDGRALSWRQLARVALVDAPGDSDAQLARALFFPDFARWNAREMTRGNVLPFPAKK